MKIELQLDEEYCELARYLGFRTVEDLINHTLDVASKSKNCHALQGRDTIENDTVLVSFQNPRLTKTDKLAKRPQRRKQ